MRRKAQSTYLALYGALFVAIGITGFILGAFLGLLRVLLFLSADARQMVEWVVWYSAMPLVAGAVLVGIDLALTVPRKREMKSLRNDAITAPRITVVLTAYNDELSIGQSVEDFKAHPMVARVIVISNNSRDATMAVAEKAGAIVFNEEAQGYGACVFRALTEATRHEDTPLVALCEGDMTFRSYDLDKFVSYISHCDIVNGTRIVEQLQQANTQLSMFMHYGNFAVAKLLEMKYLGDATLSDVGTTYKLIRTASVSELLPLLDPKVNLEFNPHLLEMAIKNGFSVLECPITFHPRVGVSKGGNISNSVAWRVGIRMIAGIMFGWSSVKQ